MRIVAPHRPQAAHLAAVTAEMRKLGPPVIRVIDAGGCYCALEGSHRLAAAHALHVMPQIVIMAEDDLMEDHDIDTGDLEGADVGWDGKSPVTVGMVSAYLGRGPGVDYDFPDECAYCYDAPVGRDQDGNWTCGNAETCAPVAAAEEVS